HFALTVGYHPQGISEMIGERRDVPMEIIEKAVSLYNFNPRFLFTGIGSCFIEESANDGFNVKNLTIVCDQKGDERIVHVPYPAQAGYGKWLDDPVFIRELPTYQLPDPQFKSGSYRSFEIYGSSMQPTFRSNDIVIAAFIEPRYWEQAIKTNQLHIIVTQEEVVIKRVVNRIKLEKVIECVSDNPEFDPYTIPVQNIIEIWKVRMKLTTYLDAPSHDDQHSRISDQLRAQQKMLENLQSQISRQSIKV
ncbi:MAG: S24 family peptidase, partial [Saprospiraceae bacterium]